MYNRLVGINRKIVKLMVGRPTLEDQVTWDIRSYYSSCANIHVIPAYFFLPGHDSCVYSGVSARVREIK